MPPKAPYSGTVRGTLVKQNTSHGGSEYARKVYCVLTGYTLWEYDDEAAAREYAKLPFKRARFDRLLAAHALSIGATVVTNNEADFADVPGLKIENWTV